jgi:hypothetical protein
MGGKSSKDDVRKVPPPSGGSRNLARTPNGPRGTSRTPPEAWERDSQDEPDFENKNLQGEDWGNNSYNLLDLEPILNNNSPPRPKPVKPLNHRKQSTSPPPKVDKYANFRNITNKRDTITPPPPRQRSPEKKKQRSPEKKRQSSPEKKRQSSPEKKRQRSPEKKRQRSPPENKRDIKQKQVSPDQFSKRRNSFGSEKISRIFSPYEKLSLSTKRISKKFKTPKTSAVIIKRRNSFSNAEEFQTKPASPVLQVKKGSPYKRPSNVGGLKKSVKAYNGERRISDVSTIGKFLKSKYLQYF